MTRYYCSGFDINNAFGHGLGDMVEQIKCKKLKKSTFHYLLNILKKSGFNFQKALLLIMK